jgi:hypothetical protein
MLAEARLQIGNTDVAHDQLWSRQVSTVKLDDWRAVWDDFRNWLLTSAAKVMHVDGLADVNSQQVFGSLERPGVGLAGLRTTEWPA